MPLCLSPDAPIGQLVAERPGRARTFLRHRIDYCVGMRSVAEACEAQGIAPEHVLAEIARQEAAEGPGREESWLEAPLPELVAHIVAVHHGYLKSALPRLSRRLAEVLKRRAASSPELVEVAAIFGRFEAELTAHMPKEEQVLFPLIVRMSRGEASAPQRAFARNPIRVMVDEHAASLRDLAALRALTDDFSPPPGADEAHRALLAELEVLEADTFVHVHLENHVLFPRTLALAPRR